MKRVRKNEIFGYVKGVRVDWHYVEGLGEIYKSYSIEDKNIRRISANGNNCRIYLDDGGALEYNNVDKIIYFTDDDISQIDNICDTTELCLDEAMEEYFIR